MEGPTHSTFRFVLGLSWRVIFKVILQDDKITKILIQRKYRQLPESYKIHASLKLDINEIMQTV